jgi:hypothetical protein
MRRLASPSRSSTYGTQPPPPSVAVDSPASGRGSGASRSRRMAARWSPAARTAREWSGTSRTFRAARERLSGKAVSASIRGAVPLTAVWAALASSLIHEDGLSPILFPVKARE